MNLSLSPEQFAEGVEFLDPVVARIGDVDAARSVSGNTVRVAELTVTVSGAAPLGRKFVGGRGRGRRRQDEEQGQ